MSLWKWGSGLKAAGTFVFKRRSALCFAARGCGPSLVSPAPDRPGLEHSEPGLSGSRRDSGWTPGSTARPLGTVGGARRAVPKAQSQQEGQWEGEVGVGVHTLRFYAWGGL